MLPISTSPARPKYYQGGHFTDGVAVINHSELQLNGSQDVANQRIAGQGQSTIREVTDDVAVENHSELQLSEPHDVANQRITS